MTAYRFDYEPLPTFEPFHRSTARDRWVVGGYGSGKSTTVCAEAQALGLQYPGMEWLVTRKTVPALRDTTEKTFVELLPPAFLRQCEVARAGGHLEHITFPNGTVYYFRSMDDWKKHRSMNLAGILWDEADEFTPEDFEGMQSRLRQTKPTPKARELGATSIPWRGNLLSANPQGRNWLWETFVGPNKRVNSAYFVSTSLDNPFLPRDYLDSLLAMPDPWVRRYVLCDFDDFAGRIYSDWTQETHVVARPEFEPAGYTIMGFDPGTAADNAVLWCYYDPAQHRYVGVAEYAEKGVAAPVHASAWRRIEAPLPPVRDRLADPRPIMTRDRGTNMTLQDQYRRLGYTFRPGIVSPKDRVPALGMLIHQGRFVVTEDCPRTYEQILNYRWEDLTPVMVARGKEPAPLKKDVDLVDAAQYIAGRYIGPGSIPKVEEDLTDAEVFAREVTAAVRKQLRRGNATGAHDLGNVSV